MTYPKIVKTVNIRLRADEIHAYTTLRNANYNISAVVRSAMLSKAKEVEARLEEEGQI